MEIVKNDMMENLKTKNYLGDLVVVFKESPKQTKTELFYLPESTPSWSNEKKK